MLRNFLTAALVISCASAAHASTKESRAAGEATYHSAGCQQCHGADWTGTDRGPDLRGVGKRLHRDELTRQVHDGGGGMPPFADALSDEQIAQLVDFLEAQKKAPKKSKPSKSAVGPTSARSKQDDE